MENKPKQSHWLAESWSHSWAEIEGEKGNFVCKQRMGWNFCLSHLQMTESVCLHELMLFTLYILLLAYWFTRFQSEDIPAEPCAHKQRLQLCRGKASGGFPPLLFANITGSPKTHLNFVHESWSVHEWIFLKRQDSQTQSKQTLNRMLRPRAWLTAAMTPASCLTWANTGVSLMLHYLLTGWEVCEEVKIADNVISSLMIFLLVSVKEIKSEFYLVNA